MVVLIDLLSFRDYILPHLRLYVNPFFEKIFRVAGRLNSAGAVIKKEPFGSVSTGFGASSFPEFDGLTRATCALATGFCHPGAC